jgi:hypothetical protein
MEGAGDNASALLAGEGISVLKANPALAVNALAEGFGAALPTLFEPSDMGAGKAAHADPHYTTDAVAVFHVYAPTPPTDTQFTVGRQGEDIVYTREYDGQSLAAGGSVVIVGPWSEEEDQIEAWTETTIEPSANEITLWANDVVKTITFTAQSDWTLDFSGDWILPMIDDVESRMSHPAYGGPAGTFTITLEIEPNYPWNGIRNAVITIDDDVSPKTFNIVQHGTTKNGGPIGPHGPAPDGFKVTEAMNEVTPRFGRLYMGVGEPERAVNKEILEGVPSGIPVFIRAIPWAGQEVNSLRMVSDERGEEFLYPIEDPMVGYRFYSFQMPEGDVTVEAVYVPAPYAVTVTLGAGGETAVADPSGNVMAGEWVQLNATPKIGYVFSEWRSTDGTALAFAADLWDQYDAETQVVMPPRELKVEAVFAPAPDSHDNNNVTVTMSPFFGEAAVASLTPSGMGETSISAPDGAIVYLSATPADGGKFEKWEVDPYVKFASGYTATSNPTAIVMPRANVNAVAKFVSNGAPMDPALKFSTQPAAELYLRANDPFAELFVEVTANNGSTPTYQWYRNSTASYEGATAIQGAVAANVPLLQTEAEKQYFFCVASIQGAAPVKSAISTVISIEDPNDFTNSRFEKDGIYYRMYHPKIQGDYEGNVTVINPTEGYESDDYSSNWYSGVVNIPNKVTFKGITYDVRVISQRAFVGCTGITEIKLAESIYEIYSGAFADCVNLEKLNISSGVELIGDGVFSGCSKLTLSVSEYNKDFLLDQYGALYKRGIVWIDFLADIFYRVTFRDLVWLPENFSSLSNSYVIPEETVGLYAYSIKNVRNLKSLVIPESLSNTLSWDFCRNCPRLTDLYINWTKLYTFGDANHFFADTDRSNITLHVPAGTKSLYEAHPLWSNGFKAIVEQ